MGWDPVLDGALADQAWASVREIADQIMTVEGERYRPEDLTLFWAYTAGAFEDEASAARYDDATNQLVARVEAGYGGLGLYGGLTGAAWVLAHVSEGGLDEFLDAVDRTLVDVLAAGPWQRDYDLIIGLTGFGVYLLERIANAGDGAPAARAAVALLVKQLDELAHRSAAGATWYTPPGLLPEWQRERWPDGYYNLGAAHGMPGVVAILGRIAAMPDAPPRAAPLCAEAMGWLRSKKLEPDPRGRYMSSLLPDGSPTDRRGRTAWCYGDPGLAMAAWNAAARTGAPVDEWRDIMLESARRPPELCSINDGGLCHGAFGLAHLFNRAYQVSREPEFRTAARDWFARGLAMRRPGEGIAGYLAMSKNAPATDPEWVASPDFLEGAAGIGMAMLAGLRAEEPGWDRLLLCDIPLPDGGAA